MSYLTSLPRRIGSFSFSLLPSRSFDLSGLCPNEACEQIYEVTDNTEENKDQQQRNQSGGLVHHASLSVLGTHHGI